MRDFNSDLVTRCNIALHVPVFLAGCEQKCKLSFSTSCGTAIPEGAAVRMVVRSDVSMELQLPASTVTVVPNKEAGTTEHHFTLPAIPSDASHECHMTLRLPATWCVRTTMPESHDLPEKLPAWKYKVILSCIWTRVLVVYCSMSIQHGLK